LGAARADRHSPAGPKPGAGSVIHSHCAPQARASPESLEEGQEAVSTETSRLSTPPGARMPGLNAPRCQYSKAVRFGRSARCLSSWQCFDCAQEWVYFWDISSRFLRAPCMPVSDLSDADIDAVYAKISPAHGIDTLKADRRAQLAGQE